MWRQIFRAIGAAFKMTVRQYRRWFVFGVFFVVFFSLIGYVLGTILIFPVSPLFNQWGFDFRNLANTGNIWWIQQLNSASSITMVFAVGTLGAYISKNEQRISFGGFLRSTPPAAWRLALLFSVIAILLIYSAACFQAESESKGIPELKWGFYLFTLLPPFVMYMGAALVYMHAAGISWSRRYLRKLVIYQIADLLISLGITLIVQLTAVLLMALNVIPPDGTWGSLSWFTAFTYAELFFTIMFFGFLVHSVFMEEKEDIELELETGASDLIVIKN